MTANVLRLICGMSAMAMLACLVGCPETPPPPKGDAMNGQMLFVTGDGVSNFSCSICHCVDASGGCMASAPNIQDEGYTAVDRKTRSQNVNHTGGKYNFTDQEVADIAAFLESLSDSD